MNENELAHVLAIINQFAPVPEDQTNVLVALSTKALYSKNTYFIKAGENPYKIGFVLQGAFRLFYTNPHGKECTKNFMVPGDFVAAYNSILRGTPSNLCIQALENAEVLLINYVKLMELVASHLYWGTLFRKFTEFAYLQKERRETELLMYNAEERYVRFKNEFSNLTGHIKQRHIASFLGMSPETLSRIKKCVDIGQ